MFKLMYLKLKISHSNQLNEFRFGLFIEEIAISGLRSIKVNGLILKRYEGSSQGKTRIQYGH